MSPESSKKFILPVHCWQLQNLEHYSPAHYSWVGRPSMAECLDPVVTRTIWHSLLVESLTRLLAVSRPVFVESDSAVSMSTRTQTFAIRQPLRLGQQEVAEVGDLVVANLAAGSMCECCACLLATNDLSGQMFHCSTLHFRSSYLLDLACCGTSWDRIRPKELLQVDHATFRSSFSFSSCQRCLRKPADPLTVKFVGSTRLLRSTGIAM